MQSIELCCARFELETKESFIDLYTKIDDGVAIEGNDIEVKEEEVVSEDVAAF
jgi:hypothetical protein